MGASDRHQLSPRTGSDPSVRLTSLQAGQGIPYGGDRVTRVSAELAAAFRAGDRLVVVQTTGDLLRIPQQESERVDQAVRAAQHAFTALSECTDEQITGFFTACADTLERPEVIDRVRTANAADVEDARRRGRSTTRLEFTDSMHTQMVAGLRIWQKLAASRDQIIDSIDHPQWRVETRRAPLGVVGFVFEGRPNVFADAVGVLRSGNTVVFRIGSDALGTARCLMDAVVRPSLTAAGLPEGAVVLVESTDRAAGWALFGDPRLALAVARGSGGAVAQLGAVARQAGVPVSLHGTGGAWMLVTAAADPVRLRTSLTHSLDRKVCNTANVVCVTRAAAATAVPVVIEALSAAASHLGTPMRLHVTEAARTYVDGGLFDQHVEVARPEGLSREPVASVISEEELGTEWEWERSPEISLCVVEDLTDGIALFNRWSPRFVVSLISHDVAEHDQVYRQADAPFVGDGFTRWVDGQYALLAPELGLSNWEGGRLLGRSAILSGDSVHTVRLRAQVTDADLRR